MTEYEVVALNSSEYESWDSLVERSPQGTIFSTSSWLQATGCDFKIYGVYQNKELIAGLPLGVRKLPLGLKSGEHPPLTPYLGILHEPCETKYISQISKEKEIQTILAPMLKDQYDRLRFQVHPSVVDLQSMIWAGYSSSVRYTYILHLDDLAQAWDEMEKRRRNDILRAERDNISVVKSDDFDGFFELVQKTFHRQKLHAGFRKAAFGIHALLKNRKQSQIFIASDGQHRPIAGVYIVWDHRRAYYLLGGYDPAIAHSGASALAIWKAIRFVSEELRLSEFDFEGSMMPAIELFFRKFGGRLTPYYSVSWARPSLDLALHLRAALRRLFRRGG
ncbi:GNAT family N-acetyltransferase [Candidatus Acetothermia bacterium]|nr:GNAT family N-acetyltransferase [Candidatus Acetothermia bacterium]MBI3643983.1 GNAT family N-acetyltransferase [Candidatus Acetothermia bacterium]